MDGEEDMDERKYKVDYTDVNGWMAMHTDNHAHTDKWMQSYVYKYKIFDYTSKKETWQHGTLSML